MPSPLQHNTKYLANIGFVNSDDLAKNHKEWYVTGVFYVVLHLIEEYLVIYKSKHTINHKDRLEEVRTDSKLKNIFDDYNTIYHESLKARYYPKVFSDDDIEVINECYDEIEKYLKPLVESKLSRFKE